jgi:hypothetical protein
MTKRPLPSKTWVSNRARLKRFAFRHRDLLPFIGGLIVSLTLLTGDRLREGIKDAESSITSAQQFFRIQMLSEASILGVKTLRQRTQPLIEDSLRRSFAPNTDVTSTLDRFESSK